MVSSFGHISAPMTTWSYTTLRYNLLFLLYVTINCKVWIVCLPYVTINWKVWDCLFQMSILFCYLTKIFPYRLLTYGLSLWIVQGHSEKHDKLDLKDFLMMNYGPLPLMMAVFHGPWTAVCWLSQTIWQNILLWVVLSACCYLSS